MRKGIDPAMRQRLEEGFPNPSHYRNPPGTLSDELIADAGMLIEKGGAVLIEGEEDLTALAFILNGKSGDIIIYGQPNEGFVLVRPGKELKKRIGGWLESAASLGHEI
jgi:hypothetical protein